MKTKAKTPKRHGVQWHKDKAWDAFSLMIRLLYADKDGMVRCTTCPAVKHYKAMQAGHFLAGRGNSILFENNNVHPQCYSCNVMNHGEQLKYYRFMVKTYGEKEVKRLERLKRKTRSFTIPELIRMREEFDMNTREILLRMKESMWPSLECGYVYKTVSDGGIEELNICTRSKPCDEHSQT